MKNIALVFGSTALTLVGMNAALVSQGYRNKPFVWGWANEAAVETGMNRQMFRLDPELIYRPNTDVRFLHSGERLYDESGFRPNGRSTVHTSEKVIVTIGDSFAYGFLLKEEETLAHLLQKHLGKSKKVRVINAGVNGYGPDQELIYLSGRVLARVRPDMVLWNVNLNDLEDADLACLYRKTNKGYRQIPGWLNTSYLQGKFLALFPGRIRSLPLVNFVADRIAPGWSRRTFGCTRNLTVDAYLDTQQQEKFRFLVQQFQSLGKRHGFTPVVILTLSQYYLDPSFPNGEMQVRNYRTFADLLRSTATRFIDANGYVIPHLEGDIAAMRGTGHTENTRNVLGKKTDTAGFPQADIFIDESTFGMKGYWHPTGKANRIIADGIARQIAAWGALD